MSGSIDSFIKSRLEYIAGQGLTLHDAADDLGVRYHTATRYALKHGVSFSHGLRGNGAKRSRNEEIRRRYLAGEKQINLAKEFEVSRERVRQICDAGGCVTETKRVRDFMMVVAGTVHRKELTTEQAATMFIISRNTVLKYCHRHGVRPQKMTAEERDELDAMVVEATTAKSIRKAAGLNSAKSAKLSRILKDKGLKGKGRSRHDDFNERKRLLSEWRGEGKSWGECAGLLAVHDGKPIGQAAVYVWARRHLPHLIERVAA